MTIILIFFSILESVIGTSNSECPNPKFWADMSYELYSNVRDLHDIFDTACRLKLETEDYPAILVSSPHVCCWLPRSLTESSHRYLESTFVGLLHLIYTNGRSVRSPCLIISRIDKNTD